MLRGSSIALRMGSNISFNRVEYSERENAATKDQPFNSTIHCRDEDRTVQIKQSKSLQFVYIQYFAFAKKQASCHLSNDATLCCTYATLNKHL